MHRFARSASSHCIINTHNNNKLTRTQLTHRNGVITLPQLLVTKDYYDTVKFTAIMYNSHINNVKKEISVKKFEPAGFEPGTYSHLLHALKM